MIRRALVLLVLLALAAPATADAQVTRKKAIWGPTEMDGESLFGTYRQLGAGIYQMKLEWDQVAVLEPLDADDPLDASYEWPDQIDTAIAEARSNRMQVALTVTGTPEWADGPQPRDLADFLTAAARRYPAVHLWIIWEDPRKDFSASRYARLLDAGYAALKARSRRNRVVGGNSSGNNAARWIRGLRLANGRTARMDLYGHDVSSRRALTAATVDRLADAAGKRLYLTLALPTNANHRYNFRVSPAVQASRLRAALRVVRRARSVYTLAYNGYTDEEQRSDDRQVESGLIDVEGERRPAYNAFRRG